MIAHDNEQQRANRCLNGHNEYICWDCADKYRTKPSYDGTYTMHNNTCYICQQHKTVSSSRKLLGFHHFI